MSIQAEASKYLVHQLAVKGVSNEHTLPQLDIVKINGCWQEFWLNKEHSLRLPLILDLSALCVVCKICPSFCGWLCVIMLWFEGSRSFSKMLARYCNQVSRILKSVVSLLRGVKFICFHSACTASWIVSYLAGCWIQSPDSHSN